MEYRRSSLEASTAPPIYVGQTRSSAVPIVAACVVVVLAAAAGGAAVWAYNGMLGHAENVDRAWAQVESSYQRRADLVPRLVETVNRYVRHERELVTDVTRERAAAAGTAKALEALAALERAQRESAGARGAADGTAPLDPATLEAIQRSEAGVGRGVRAVLAVAEAYPQLRSADQFLELQAQLEGTENRIHVARMAYNDAVRTYNAARVQIPTRWVAEARGFEARPYFRAEEGAAAAGALPFE